MEWRESISYCLRMPSLKMTSVYELGVPQLSNYVLYSYKFSVAERGSGVLPLLEGSGANYVSH